MSHFPKCKFCGKEHRLGQCPDLQTKSSGTGGQADKKPASTVVAPPHAAKQELPQPAPLDTKPSPDPANPKKKRKRKGGIRQKTNKKPKAKAITPIGPVKRGRPYHGAENRTLSLLRPWAKEGMSKATWYRRRKEAAAKPNG